MEIMLSSQEILLIMELIMVGMIIINSLGYTITEMMESTIEIDLEAMLIIILTLIYMRELYILLQQVQEQDIITLQMVQDILGNVITIQVTQKQEWKQQKRLLMVWQNHYYLEIVKMVIHQTKLKWHLLHSQIQLQQTFLKQQVIVHSQLPLMV